MATHLASAYREYPCSYPKPGWVEQDADLLVEATMVTTNSILLKIGSLSRFYFY